MSCKFNDGNLHTKAETKVWDVVLAGISYSGNFAFHAAGTETARYKDTGNVSKNLGCVFVGDVLGVYPFDVDSRTLCDSAVL